MAPVLDLSQLKPYRATIEVRYDNAYLLWDRAGQIWAKLNERCKLNAG